jgi:hypothetical protein
MTSMVLGDSTLRSLTPSVNAPLHTQYIVMSTRLHKGTKIIPCFLLHGHVLYIGELQVG